jgi:hypothetical protein
LVTSLAHGATVRYFFNTSTCSPSKSPEDIPVFGGDIKMFMAAPNSEYDDGRTIFSHVQYINDNITGTLKKPFHCKLNYFIKIQS